MTEPEKKHVKPVSDRAPDLADEGAEPLEEEEPEPEIEPWTPERALVWNAYYDIYVALGVLLLVFIASANRISHSSIWTQLQTGKIIAATGSPVTTDLFSYTREGAPWVNIPWLFEWSHALLFKSAADLAPSDPIDPAASAAKAEQIGAGALVALNALARLLTAFFLMGIRRSGPGKWWAALCVLLALGLVVTPVGVTMGGIALPGPVTPSTWGLLLLSVALWTWHRTTVLGKASAVYALIPLFALWANVDDSFLLGLIFLGAGAVGWTVKKPSAAERGLKPGVAFGVLAASALACLINPATFRVFPAAASWLTDKISSAEGPATIDQLSYFGSAFQEQAGTAWRAMVAYYTIIVAVGLASFWLNRRRFDLGRFLVYVVAAALWALLIRFAPEFAAVFAATLILNGQEWYQDAFGTEGRTSASWSVWSVGGRAVTIVLIFLGVARGLTSYGASYGESRFGFGFERDELSFEAADFLKSAPLKGQVLNTTLSQGDALIWRAYPDRKTFMDSRKDLFPRAQVKQLQEMRNALKDDDVSAWKPFFDEYKISAVMIEPSTASNTYRALSQSPNWIPFHDDGNVVLFGRADAAAPEDLAFFKANRLEPELRAYKIAKPAPLPDRPPTPISWMDNYFQWRALVRPQPHTESARRWLIGPDFDPASGAIPDPARCLLAVREARAALAFKPDDTQAYRLLAEAYRLLMIQETALLGGLALTPDNATKIAQAVPRGDLLMNRFRERVTALNYAIQTTPPPRDANDRRVLQQLNLELSQLFSSVSFIDLARDRLQAAFDATAKDDATPEALAQMSQQLAMLDEQVKQVQTQMNDAAIEQQAGALQLGMLALNQGAPGLALKEFEEADRTATNPALVKPQLLDLYCDTGQPDKAVEMLSSGTIEDPNFGAEPGVSAMRQSRAYFLLGNADFAATLLEKYAVPRLRADRAMRGLGAAASLIKGEVQSGAVTLLEIPDRVSLQATWEYEAGQVRLEQGLPELAAEHFGKALTLVPDMTFRPVMAYYLEKIGKPVPPSSKDAATPAPTASEGADATAKEAPAAKP